MMPSSCGGAISLMRTLALSLMEGRNMDYQFIFALGLLAVIVVEMLLQATWNHWYFTTGVPLFKMERAVHGAVVPPAIETVIDRMQTAVSTRLRFRAMGPTEHAFREKLIGSRSAPIMRGLITYDYHEGKIRLRGYAHWHVLFLVLDWYAYLISNRPSVSSFPGLWLSVLVPLLLYGVFYLFQIRKFRKIFAIAAEMWSEPSKQPNKSLEQSP
jgi:hypothetical protein